MNQSTKVAESVRAQVVKLAVIGRQDYNFREQNAISSGDRQASGALTATRESAGGSFGSDSSPKRRHLILRFVEIGVALILGVLAAMIILRIIAPLPLPQGNVVSGGDASPSAAAPLVVKNPFPTASVAPIIEEVAPTVADTTLDLTLTGVWVEEAGGSATIETPDGKQGRFAVGDEIVDSVRLDAVYADQVIISRNGVRESLRFESKTTVASPTPRASTGARPQGLRPTAQRGGATSVTNALSGRISEFMRLAPATDSNGNLVVDIYAARDRATFNAYGLQDGDRLVAVNGKPPPTNPAALRAVMNALQRDAQAVLTVRRNGQEIPVTLRLDPTGNE